MCYCSPKAIDFAAYRNGERLGPRDPDGLAARWRIARQIETEGVNMLRLGVADVQVIEDACEATVGAEIEIRPDYVIPCFR